MTTTSYAEDIRPLFRDTDVRCMRKTSRKVLLDEYSYMADPVAGDGFADHAHARHVYCHLQPNGCEPRMPYGGPYWSDTQLALYRQWMDDGFLP